jgi:hypothetical protein
MFPLFVLLGGSFIFWDAGPSISPFYVLFFIGKV